MSLTYISSTKGKRKVVDTENYLYEKHKEIVKKTIIYWRCEKFYNGCHARIHTDYNTAESVILIIMIIL